ncbi:MAG: ABC-F family ATP-binding cassette domain-containing protein [Actinomycetota bacterium]
MGFIEVTDAAYSLPGGWTLFEGVSFRVPEGEHAALVGANGIGKSTLLRILARLEPPTAGAVRVDGRVGLMRQFIGSGTRSTTVREFLLAYSEPRVADAAARVGKAERWMRDHPCADAQLRYAEALAHWGEAGGYEAEVLFDQCTHASFGAGYPECAQRDIETLSGGERKRLALEVIFRAPFDVILLDEPDNTLDIEGKRWLEDTVNASGKTILMVSHDRTVLDRAATRIVTLEGRAAWTHAGRFATYAEARDGRIDRLDEDHRRYDEERRRLTEMVKEMKRKAAYNDGWASKARSAEHRLERFEVRNAPPAKPEVQDVRMRIAGGRTGKVALRIVGLGIEDIVRPFDAEIWFGERLGVIGPNGTGKTHFVRLLAGEPVRHEGEWRLGARVEPALFAQLHERPDIADLPILHVLRRKGLTMTESKAALRRYELDRADRNPFGLLSGGQQARFQLLLMEIDSPTMLLLDEPTDNLDVASADALEEAIGRYEGTVIAVTHDRWFMRGMDRFLFFEQDGTVRELLESPYELEDELEAPIG